jgi:hypothetical protein
VRSTDALIEKLYKMGLIPTKKSLTSCENIAVSAFCRRRLPVVLVRLKMCETLKEAVTFVEQGHIRVGEHPRTAPLHPPFPQNLAGNDEKLGLELKNTMRAKYLIDPLEPRPCLLQSTLCNGLPRMLTKQMQLTGPNVVTEPAFHVTRNMEDFVTWVDSSKIRRKVMKYNDALDDFDLLQA